MVRMPSGHGEGPEPSQALQEIEPNAYVDSMKPCSRGNIVSARGSVGREGEIHHSPPVGYGQVFSAVRRRYPSTSGCIEQNVDRQARGAPHGLPQRCSCDDVEDCQIQPGMNPEHLAKAARYRLRRCHVGGIDADRGGRFQLGLDQGAALDMECHTGFCVIAKITDRIALSETLNAIVKFFRLQ